MIYTMYSPSGVSTTTSQGEHGYLYAAAALFGLMVHWINQFPMIYKHMLMRMNSGNLRANMMIYKQLGAKEDAPYVVLETQGPVGCYNRANRSLFHFTEALLQDERHEGHKGHNTNILASSSCWSFTSLSYFTQSAR